jgi:hypothetical protein
LLLRNAGVAFGRPPLPPLPQHAAGASHYGEPYRTREDPRLSGHKPRITRRSARQRSCVCVAKARINARILVTPMLLPRPSVSPLYSFCDDRPPGAPRPIAFVHLFRWLSGARPGPGEQQTADRIVARWRVSSRMLIPRSPSREASGIRLRCVLNTASVSG